MNGRVAGLFALLAAMSIAGRARAEPSPLVVTTEGCDDLSAPEIERILRIELAQVLGHWSGTEPLRVELACEGAHVRVVAIDPVTDKRLSRDVSLQHARDRDRIVALLVSQLFLTSWSELLLRRPSEASVPAPAPAASLARAAEGLARGAMAPSSRGWAVTALFGARLRDVDAPILGARAAVRPALLLGEHWSLSLELGYERGTVDRASGLVGYGIASALVGGGLRSSCFGPVVFEVGARLGAGYVDVNGDATAPALGSSASGAVAELAIAAGPTIRIGDATIGLELAAGLTAPRATAHMARDRDVALGGPWAGLSVAVGVLAGEGPP